MQQQGKLIWHISCDELGLVASSIMALVACGCAGTGEAILLKISENCENVITTLLKLNGKRHTIKIYHDFYRELIEYFFKTRWLAFH